jgi:hypothetical protein
LKSTQAFGGFPRVGELLDLCGQAVAEHGLLADELFDQRLEAVVLVRGNRRRAADDQRGPGLVDEDRVDLVHNGKIMSALNLLLAAGGHAIVAEVIESELAVRSVGDVALILLAALLRHLVVLDDADRRARGRL